MKYFIVSLFVFCISCTTTNKENIIRPRALNNVKCPEIYVPNKARNIQSSDILFETSINIDNAQCIADDDYITLSADVNLHTSTKNALAKNQIIALPIFYKISVISNASEKQKILEDKYFFTSAEFMEHKSKHDIKQIKSFRIAKDAYLKNNISLKIFLPPDEKN